MCSAQVGEEHGFVYLGGCGYEAVYRLKDQSWETQVMEGVWEVLTTDGKTMVVVVDGPVVLVVRARGGYDDAIDMAQYIADLHNSRRGEGR